MLHKLYAVYEIIFTNNALLSQVVLLFHLVYIIFRITKEERWHLIHILDCLCQTEAAACGIFINPYRFKSD